MRRFLPQPFVGPSTGSKCEACRSSGLGTRKYSLRYATIARNAAGVRGAAIGTQTFVERYVEEKVSDWVDAVERLSSIAHTQPHAAYSMLQNI